jgi:uncharacterized RDD family membrane protein YckC
VKLATIGERAAARVIDVFVPVVGYLVLAAVFAILALMLSAVTSSGNSGGAVAGFAGFLLALFLIGLLANIYEIAMVALFGRTVGMMIMRITIIRQADGQKPNLVNAILRFIAPGLAGLIPLFGQFCYLLVYVSPIFDGSGRQQGWHDKLATTLVVSSR